MALAFVYPHLMVSPGPLVRVGTADLATDCFACHAPWRGAAAQRCIACHAVADIGLRTTKGVALAAAGAEDLVPPGAHRAGLHGLSQRPRRARAHAAQPQAVLARAAARRSTRPLRVLPRRAEGRGPPRPQRRLRPVPPPTSLEASHLRSRAAGQDSTGAVHELATRRRRTHCTGRSRATAGSATQRPPGSRPRSNTASSSCSTAITTPPA